MSTSSRSSRGEALFLAGAVREITPNLYFVMGGQDYTVTLGDEPTCTCKDFEIRGMGNDGFECKHCIAARLFNENKRQEHTVREMVVA